MSAPSVWHMYRSMVGIGVACGVLIVTVFQTTRPAIERNKAEALQRAILQVLPAARSSATLQLTPERTFYAGYDEHKRLVGVAIEASGMGYADVIRVLYGYSFSEQAIIGIRVLESKETPGLGDKIETDPGFLRNFERLDVRLTADGSALANPIVAVKAGKKTSPWQVDGITGATISSKAIARILADSATEWIPRLSKRIDEFRTAKPEAE